MIEQEDQFIEEVTVAFHQALEAFSGSLNLSFRQLSLPGKIKAGQEIIRIMEEVTQEGRKEIELLTKQLPG